jgi:glycosyltransferase involved in cell wall biosynthesis
VRYEECCGSCPALGSTAESDLSRQTWERKRRYWAQIDLTLVAPSRWMAETASRSSLLRGRRVEVIPNCLDTEIFKPAERAAARAKLGLPASGKLLLFSALSAGGDRRKGAHFIKPVLEALAATASADSLALVVLGEPVGADEADLPFRRHSLGLINDEARTTLAYAAADAFIGLSMQDNLPNTVMEALSCGTPCVAFDVGGISDLIEDGANGRLVPPFDVATYVEALHWVLGDETRHAALSARARASVTERFSGERIARRHLSLYEELCSKDRPCR